MSPLKPPKIGDMLYEPTVLLLGMALKVELDLKGYHHVTIDWRYTQGRRIYSSTSLVSDTTPDITTLDFMALAGIEYLPLSRYHIMLDGYRELRRQWL
jgi:hypothetical protein